MDKQQVSFPGSSVIILRVLFLSTRSLADDKLRERQDAVCIVLLHFL